MPHKYRGIRATSKCTSLDSTSSYAPEYDAAAPWTGPILTQTETLRMVHDLEFPALRSH